MKKAMPAQILNAIARTLLEMATVGSHLRSHERAACWQAAEELEQRARDGEAMVPLPERTTPISDGIPVEPLSSAALVDKYAAGACGCGTCSAQGDGMCANGVQIVAAMHRYRRALPKS